MKDKTQILINALNTIADYDYKSGSEGICPYGCDTPHIARKALVDYAKATNNKAVELDGAKSAAPYSGQCKHGIPMGQPCSECNPPRNSL